MKKLTLFVLISILLTGCSSKTLTCTKTEEKDPGATVKKQVIVFENNKLKNMEVNMDLKLNDSYQDYSSMIKKSFEKSFEEYKNKKGITLNIQEKSNVITVNIKADYNKLNDESKKLMKITDTSYKSVKKSVQKDGYTCK